MRKLKMPGLIAIALCLPFIGCDSDEEITVDVERFVAPLASVNPNLATVSGTATIEIIGDAMRVTVRAIGLDSVMHMQFVGSGTSCPTTTSDTNADGVIDVEEGMAAYGPFLLALDADIEVRSDSVLTFPVTDSIAYIETAVYSAVENSMRGAPVTEFTTNIPITGDFIPQGLAVVILGDASPLPTTLEFLPGLTASETVPVACGVFNRTIASN